MSSTQTFSATVGVVGIALLVLLPLGAYMLYSQQTAELHIYTPRYQQVNPEAMQKIFEQKSGIRLVRATPPEGATPLQALAAGEADLALVENSEAFVPGIRAVLPVYKSVLHILVRQDYTPADPAHPLRGSHVHIADNSGAARALVRAVAKRNRLEPGDYHVSDHFQPGTTDTILYFGPITADNPAWYRPGFRLVSLDERLNPQKELERESVGYILPHLQPMVIPPLTYDLPGGEAALLTVAVDTLLVTRKEIPVDQIYQVARTFVEQKPRFTALAPYLFAGITESFDPLDLNFPLHAGARRYLERNEPGLLERYAETINLLTYLAFMVITGLVGFNRWRAQRKKDRIDTFYARVLAIRERAATEQHDTLIGELRELENQAFASLIAEKLAANESFRILIDLVTRTRSELGGRQPPPD